MTTASRLAGSNTTYVSVEVSGSKNAWMCMTVSPLKRVATEVPWPAIFELAILAWAMKRGETRVSTELAQQDDGGNHDDEPAERSLQVMRGQPPPDARTCQAPRDRERGDRCNDSAIDMHVRRGAGEAGERVHRDHEQRGPHGFAHGEAAEQREGWQDDEATTGSEHARDKANPEPRREDARQVGLLRGAEALGRSGAHEHRYASRNHHQRKCCDEYR